MSESIAIEHHLSIPNKLTKAMPFIICSLASLFYVYEFFLRVLPAAITQELMRDFSMNARTLGFVSVFFFYTYSIMQIPAGLLLDRFGPRIILSLSMLICTVAAFLFGSTHSIPMLGLSRAMVGFASSFAFIGALLLASRWFPAKYFALITGFVQLMGCIGAIVSGTPLTLLANHIGWRPSLHWAGITGLVLTVLFWVVLRDHPKTPNTREVETKEIASEQIHNELTRLRTVLKNSQTWLIGLSGFCCWTTISAFPALWGVPFLMAKYHTTASVATTGTAVLWIGFAIASPLAGWWSNKIQSRRIPLIVTSAVSLISGLGVIYLHQPPWWLMCTLLFFFGAAVSGQSVTFGLIQDIHPPAVVGTAIGFNNMALVSCAVIVQPLIGVLLSTFWTGQMQNGAPLYSVACYEKALTVIPVAAFIGLLNTIFFLKETGCRAKFEVSSSNL